MRVAPPGHTHTQTPPTQALSRRIGDRPRTGCSGQVENVERRIVAATDGKVFGGHNSRNDSAACITQNAGDPPNGDRPRTGCSDQVENVEGRIVAAAD